MDSQLIRIEVDLYDSTFDQEQAIEDELKKRGHPLRWIVLDVDKERQKACIEAVILIQG